MKVARASTLGADREFYTRFRERLRYGLLTQEALDRLARAGLVLYPYDLVLEGPHGASKVVVPETARELRFTALGNEHIEPITALPCRPLTPASIVERMKHSRGFGAFVGEELAGYTWADFRRVPTAVGGETLFELDSRGAYIFDMYIARAYRGKRIAPWLRHCVNEQLRQSGRDRIYSISLVFNSSTRRFKTRIGSTDLERRLLVRLGGFLAFDIRLRSYSADALPTPRAVRFRSRLRST